MKKLLALLLCLLTLTGCGSAEAPETNAPATAATSPTAPPESLPPVTEAETVPPTTAAPLPEGTLFLSVSRLDFSVVGESEDIYLGTLPREEVTFESADESVATFENGILTAVGTGSTTVTAAFGDQVLTVSVSCLAATEEELLALDDAVLRSAKRYPPVMGDEPMDYFADAAIVGDSISYILFQWETMYNYLGEPLFLVRGGTGLNGLVRDYKLVYYKGKETKIDNALADAQPRKVFIMLGQNDLRYREIADCMDSWVTLVDRIRTACPDIEIHIQSCTPEWIKSTGSNFNNEKIEEYNGILKAFAEENGCYFVDIHYYTVDHLHRMPGEYELDKSIHMNEAGCYAWMQALKAYAFLQQQ